MRPPALLVFVGLLPVLFALSPRQLYAGADYLPRQNKQPGLNSAESFTERSHRYDHGYPHRHYHYGFLYPYPYVVPYGYHPQSYYRPYYNHHLDFKLYYRPYAYDYAPPAPGARYLPPR